MVEPTPKVSIIIPVYNVEKYLNMCLKTVTCQTLQDIEIIVVNDSTPDNSEKIINNYIAKDDRIIYIKHSSNKGHGGALNSGLRKVRGEYTWMVDSDDFIDSNACHFLYNYASYNKLDALAFSANNFQIMNGNMVFYYNGSYWYPKCLLEKVYSGPELILAAYVNNHILVTPPWAYFFNSDLIRNYSFRENVSYEDTDGVPIFLNSLKRISCIKYTPYFRLIHDENSISYIRNVEIKISEKMMLQRFQISTSLFHYIKKNNINKNDPLAYYAFRIFTNAIMNDYSRYLLNKTAEKKKTEEVLYEIYGLMRKIYNTTSWEIYLRKSKFSSLNANDWYNFGQYNKGLKLRFLIKLITKKLHLYNFLRTILKPNK